MNSLQHLKGTAELQDTTITPGIIAATDSPMKHN